MINDRLIRNRLDGKKCKARIREGEREVIKEISRTKSDKKEIKRWRAL